MLLAELWLYKSNKIATNIVKDKKQNASLTGKKTAVDGNCKHAQFLYKESVEIRKQDNTWHISGQWKKRFIMTIALFTRKVPTSVGYFFYETNVI